MSLTGNYYYLLSSLPYLSFGRPPPISHRILRERSGPWLEGLSLRLFQLARITPEGPPPPEIRNSPLRRWYEFEHGLRTELARRRARILGRQEEVVPAASGRPPHRSLVAAGRAFEASNPLEAEVSLIAERWKFLVDLAFLHYFDLTALLTYSLKLQLLERLSMFDEGRGLELLTTIHERNIHGGKRD